MEMFLYDPEKMDVTLPLHTWTATELLLEVAILATLIWYIQFLWSRRKSFVHTSNMPGPLYIPLIGSAMIATGDSYDTLHNMMELFREYPGIFRAWFGLKLFIGVSKPEYFEILLTKCLKKKYLYYSALPLVGDGIFSAPLDIWKRHRKIITPTFNQKILDNFVAVFSEQSNILVEQLKKHSGKGEFDIFQMVYRCTLDGICETAMGVKMNCQIKVHPYSEWVDRMIEIILQRITVIWYHVDFIFNMTPMSCELENITRNIHQFTANIVEEKRKERESKRNKEKSDLNADYEENTPKRKAFLDYLIEMTGDGDSKFTDKELTDEVTTFVIAGSDTTASTNSFMFTMLGLHQDMQQRIYEEAIHVVGPARSVEPADLPHLKYTERFIKESLRLFPVTPMILRDVQEDVAVGEYVVPRGATIIFGILSAHTDEKYWPKPYKFDPDRFLPEEVAKRHPCAHIPFSYGSRNCVGMKYGMMSMKALLATVVRKYKIYTSYKCVEDIKLKNLFFAKPRDGFKVSVELR